ncbi:hypothetical protein Y032_0168g182 [Ancylostoma ceylanicum]|uniref:Uncharacterized protein n=1 Tax=Ancylostoma ceylanicum TaxID=53326 RepID=A0A016SW02_9BILA|nr:hypothetical protein Y032_0168g182 [Ancylostoma ceylanicum]
MTRELVDSKLFSALLKAWTKKFDHTVHGAKDRIVYEWVLLKEYEDKFRPEMLRSNGIVRRKNILVQYNG